MILLIVIRILFAASMVFIIGYIFGGFSKRPGLTRMAKIAAILIIPLFIAVNGLYMRSYFGHFHGRNHWGGCDSTQVEGRYNH
jgi:hypothetical protein